MSQPRSYKRLANLNGRAFNHEKQGEMSRREEGWEGKRKEKDPNKRALAPRTLG